MITVRPLMSGMKVRLEVVMDNNVSDDNNAVNDNFIRYALTVTERPYHHGSLRTALLAEAERTVRDRGAQDLSLRELARAVGVSHSAPRRHFTDRQALLDALAESGFARLGSELRAAVDGAGEDFQARLRAMAAAYVRFATRDAALLELMFAGKHRQPAGPLQEAATRAFAVVLEVMEQGQLDGVLERGEPQRVGLVLFATIQGVAALVNGGMIDEQQLDELFTDAIGRFLRGSRGAADESALEPAGSS
jgi:AcrR family transcriptional regulator